MLLTREDVQQAIRMRKEGTKGPEIFTHVHVSTTSFYNYLHKYKMFDQWNAALPVVMTISNNKRHKPIPLGPLVTMYQRGHSHREMAAFFKCSMWKVQHHIKKYGLHPDIKTHQQDLFTVSKYDREVK